MNSTEQTKRVHEPRECFDRLYGEDCDGLADWVPDPYLEEIHGEREFGWFCPGVYHGLCMDI